MKVCVCAGRRVWGGAGVRHHGGAVIDLDDEHAQALIARGVVEAIKAPKKKAPAKKKVPAKKKAE